MENALQVEQTQGIERARPGSVAQARPHERIVEVRPRMDVLENGEAIRILVDVPGVDAAHADVHVEMPHLRIACTRDATAGAAIRYAASLTLPTTIDGDSLTAELRDGVLEIGMRKTAHARARRIEVKRG